MDNIHLPPPPALRLLTHAWGYSPCQISKTYHYFWLIHFAFTSLFAMASIVNCKFVGSNQPAGKLITPLDCWSILVQRSPLWVKKSIFKFDIHGPVLVRTFTQDHKIGMMLKKVIIDFLHQKQLLEHVTRPLQEVWECWRLIDLTLTMSLLSTKPILTR